ncbi:MAG: xanthine dehydrogenase small subunit [Pseudomonadota bacterium]
MIRFLHGFEEVAIREARADTTVLKYLRDQRNMKGTKEGCASGDCGACTVVTASSVNGQLHYEPINACIATLGGLHGKQLISVEQLADDEDLHPVQKAMVENHGSQCGFCTPGFVMSMFAFFQQHQQRAAQGEELNSKPANPLDDHAVHEALGGNLCRCTGYRPIVDAAKDAMTQRQQTGLPDKFERREQHTLERLERLKADHQGPAELNYDDSRYFRPSTSQDLADLMQEFPESRLIAGGTDLLLEHTQQLKPLAHLIDLKSVPELMELGADASAIRIGAAVSHAEAQDLVLADYPELRELIERFGSLQIRSQGTVVGNVANASPIGDWPPVLLALDATLVLQSSGGQRLLPIDEFFLDYRKTSLQPGEFLREIHIPRRPIGLCLRAYKISKRFEDDISSVCGVFALHLDDQETEARITEARVAFGGMAAIPKRASNCEQVLRTQVMSERLLNDAAQVLHDEFDPISDARASAGYRRRVASNLLRRFTIEFGGQTATRTHPHSAIQTYSGPG